MFSLSQTPHRVIENLQAIPVHKYKITIGSIHQFSNEQF